MEAKAWKDTVMEEIENVFIGKVIFASSPEEEKRAMASLVARAQAEISFKIGYDKALAQLAGMTEECKQMGRSEFAREVLGIIENPKRNNYRLKEIAEYCEAKLKDWGV